LAQGNIKLVREALAERGRLLKNAPLMTSTQPFVVPVFSLWEKFYYSAGLMLYDVLSGKLSLGKTRLLSRKKTLELLPNINPTKVAGGILYYDGQFNDAELCIELAHTAERFGATVLNYTKAVGFIKEKDIIVGVELEDTLGAAVGAVRCKCVINATGVFTDAVLQMDDPHADTLVYPSQGIHLVVSPKFFRGINAMMIPKTDDGRVLFAVPWQGKVVIGTTDTHVDHIDLEPLPLAEEIHFVLEHFNRYTNAAITKDDVLSVFVGLRPLVRSANAGSNISSLLSRDHTLVVSPSRLVTITGGKWTTYRKMAEDAVNNAVFVAKLDGADRSAKSGAASGAASGAKKCITKDLPIGDGGEARELAAQLTLDEPMLGNYLDHEFAAFHHITYAIRVVDVVVAARCKYVRTVEDFLARRSRLLFLDARAAIQLAPSVATILQKELNWSNEERDAQLQSFIQLAQQYIIH
jgi:glycerol-3-phosphate dehydrogenase